MPSTSTERHASGASRVSRDGGPDDSRKDRALPTEGLFEQIFEEAPVGMALVSVDGRIERVNPAFGRMLVYAPAELAGRPVREISHPEEFPEHWQQIKALENLAESRFTAEKRYLHKSGSIVWGLLSVSIIRDRDGTPLFHLAQVQDITEHRRAEQREREMETRLHRSQRMESIGMIAAGIAHTFNNLLTVVLGHADLARHGLPEDSPIREDLDRIATAGRRAANLTRQMLAFAGKAPLRRRPIDLGAFVREMADPIRASLLAGVDFRIESPPTLPPVEADTTQLGHLLLNLALNAAEAIGPRGGAIVLSLGQRRCTAAELQAPWNDPVPEGDCVFLAIKDDGCGIAKEHLPRIFDPFYSTKFLGRGLGLAAALGIARSHGGAIVVESAPNVGSTFTLWLPAARGVSPVLAEPPARSVPQTGSGTLLLADDDSLVLDVAGSILRRLGFEVVAASTGTEAIEAARRHSGRLRAVLLDLVMPGMSGRETLRGLRDLASKLPIIVITGYSEEFARQETEGQPYEGFIQKPLSMENLSAELGRVLALKPGSPP